MRNFVQHGVNLTLPAPGTILSGDVVVIGSLSGIAAGDALTGADFDLVTEGVYTLPKVAAQAIAIGAKVYWDAASKLVTTVASGNTLLGVAVTAAANPSASVNVKLGLPV